MSLDFINTLRTKEEIEFEVEEIKIKLPNGGHINGKWWGNKSIRPFLCLHGWQDNAGSFDRLIPHLQREFSYLAIDFPGHGRSSWLPQGVPYHSFDYLYLFTFLMKEYKWEKLSIIAHSLGAKLAFVYAGIYPERVDIIVNIEELKSLVPGFNTTMKELRNVVNNFMVADQKVFDKNEPPAYTIDEMVDRLYISSEKQVTRVGAPYLLKRNIIPSKKYPGKFCFSRDPRLKFLTGFNLPLLTNIEIARDIKIPYLCIRVIKSTPLNDRANYDAIYEVMKKSKNFEFFHADSTSHYVHLIEPEKIADAIGKFIIKHKTTKSHL